MLHDIIVTAFDPAMSAGLALGVSLLVGVAWTLGRLEQAPAGARIPIPARIEGPRAPARA